MCCSVKRCGLPTGARSQAPDPGRKKMRRVLVGTAASDTPYGCCFAVGVQSQGAGACQASPRRRHLNIRTKDARGQGMPSQQRAACCQSFVWFPWALRPQRATCCFVSFPCETCGTCVATSATVGLSSPPPPTPGLRRQHGRLVISAPQACGASLPRGHTRRPFSNYRLCIKE